MKSTLLTCLSLMLLITACGKTAPTQLISGNTDNDIIKTETYSYQFKLNGCDTGEHVLF